MKLLQFCLNQVINVFFIDWHVKMTRHSRSWYFLGKHRVRAWNTTTTTQKAQNHTVTHRSQASANAGVNDNEKRCKRHENEESSDVKYELDDWEDKPENEHEKWKQVLYAMTIFHTIKIVDENVKKVVQSDRYWHPGPNCYQQEERYCWNENDCNRIQWKYDQNPNN